MSITDELRDSIDHLRDKMADVDYELTDIADRIDERHKHAIGYVDDRDPETMAEHGWVRLPKDADGEYIHIGDVMEGVDKYDSLKKVMGEVTTISFDATFDPDDSRSVGIRVWSDDRRSYHTAYLDPRASVYRHYHAPTVEDVLTEFGIDWEHESDCEDRAALLKDYAAKLRLADGGDD